MSEKSNDSSTAKKANGLVVPGSNWEKFRHLISEPGSKEKDSKSSGHSPRSKMHHKRNRKPLTTTQPSKLIETQNTSGNQDQSKPEDTERNIITKHIAMDCEMVGIGDGTESMIARVSVVNHHGVCIYDKYVKPTERVEDYRTAVSGIRPQDLTNGEEFKIVQEEIAALLKGRILVGHSLKNDLAVLYLSHPKRNLRDTARYKPFKKVAMGNTPSLKKLASELLGTVIQSGEHNSIEDARSAMQLYMLYKNKWECDLRSHR